MVGQWSFFRFGLIVTGETEEQCLPALFRILAAHGTCSFKVIRRIGQRSPRSAKRAQKMVGEGKRHGTLIVAELDIRHVLTREDTCASLRTLFAWASAAIGQRDWLPSGRLLPTTQGQIGTLARHLAAGD